MSQLLVDILYWIFVENFVILICLDHSVLCFGSVTDDREKTVNTHLSLFSLILLEMTKSISQVEPIYCYNF